MSVHLDGFIDSTSGLPTELTRLLTLIGVLDERSADLRQKVQHQVEDCCQAQHGGERAAGGAQASGAYKSITSNHSTLVQWAEEKLALSVIASELVDYHLGQLDQDIASLQTEVELNVAEEAAVEAAFVATQAGPSGRRRAWRDDSAEPKDAKRRRAEGAHSGHATPEPRSSPAPTMDSAQPSASRSHKAPRREKMSAVPTATLEPQSKRRAAAAAAMHGAAAALADEDAVDDVMEEMASGGPVGEVAAEKEGEANHPPLPPGFKVSAPEPQAPGSLLVASDIGPALESRMAELYWPDDNCWYLVQIRGVDIPQAQASIVYMTGETEMLNLTEIVKDGHMSLITRV